MRVLAVACLLAVTACSRRLEPGPLSREIDLRQYLPDSLRSVTTPTDSTFEKDVQVGPDGAHVRFTWNRFQRGSGRYLGTVGVRLLDSVRYDSVGVGPPSDLKNSGTKQQIVASATLSLAWSKRVFLWHKSGTTRFEFDAAGRTRVE